MSCRVVVPGDIHDPVGRASALDHVGSLQIIGERHIRYILADMSVDVAVPYAVLGHKIQTIPISADECLIIETSERIVLPEVAAVVIS
jgi:hypothetical protein